MNRKFRLPKHFRNVLLILPPLEKADIVISPKFQNSMVDFYQITKKE